MDIIGSIMRRNYLGKYVMLDKSLIGRTSVKAYTKTLSICNN